MNITEETRIIDLNVGQLKEIFQRAAEQTSVSITKPSKPMTTEQLSEFLGGMPLPTVYYKIAKCGMPHVKEGGRLFFYEDQITSWLKSHQRNSVEDSAEQKFHQFKQRLIAKK